LAFNTLQIGHFEIGVARLIIVSPILSTTIYMSHYRSTIGIDFSLYAQAFFRNLSFFILCKYSLFSVLSYNDEFQEGGKINYLSVVCALSFFTNAYNHKLRITDSLDIIDIT